MLLVPSFAALGRRVWRREWGGASVEDALWLFGLLWFILLSFAAKTHMRYFLPLNALVMVLASCQAGRWLKASGWRKGLAAGAVALAVMLFIVESVGLLRAFHHDSRRDLAEFFRIHVPHGAVVVQDKRVGLPYDKELQKAMPELVIPQKLIHREFAAQAGTLSELRQHGVTHVAVARGQYSRFFKESLRPSAAVRPQHERFRAFYEELFRIGEPIWKSQKGRLPYLQPEITVYRLPSEQEASAAPTPCPQEGAEPLVESSP